jgi:hypothetical protein
MRRLVVTVIAGSVLAGLVIGGILLVRDESAESTDYDSAVADRFLSVCTADATDLSFSAPAEFCVCTYERISVELSFERFVEIDEAMREDPGAVPDEIDRIRTDCFVGTATVPTTADPGALPTVTTPAAD